MSEEGRREAQGHTVASLDLADKPAFDYRGIIEAKVLFVALPLLLDSPVLSACLKFAKNHLHEFALAGIGR